MTEPVDAAVETVQAFCDGRIPDDLRDEIRIECSRRGKAITIVERRPPWNAELVGSDWTSMAIAKLVYDPAKREWSLRCRDSSDRWWRYDGIGETPTVDPLLAEIDRDPTGIFWG